MRLTRRISSAFKDIEGGQLLGASNDYEIKLLVDLKNEEVNLEEYSTKDNIIKSALTPLREDNLIKVLPKKKRALGYYKSFPTAPYPRSAILQVMRR